MSSILTIPKNCCRQKDGNALLKIETEQGKCETFVCQFNPEDLRINTQGKYSHMQRVGEDSPIVQFMGGDVSTLEMELFFDTSSSYEVKQGQGVTRPEKTELLQEHPARGESFNKFPAEDVSSVIRKARLHIMSRLNCTDRGLSLHYKELTERMKFTEWERFLFPLSFSVSYDERYEIIFAYLQDDIRIPTLRLAISLYQLEKLLCDEEKTAAIQRKGYLYRCFLNIADTAEYNPTAYAVQLDRRVCTYLLGRNEISEQMSEFISVWLFTDSLEPVCIRQTEQKQITRCLKELFCQSGKEGKVFGLYGPEGIGKKYLLRMAAAECRKNLLFVDVGKLLVGTVEELRILFAGIMRERGNVSGESTAGIFRWERMSILACLPISIL